MKAFECPLTKRRYLIVVDYQWDFVVGVLGTRRALELYSIILQIILKYAAEGWCIIFTQDTHDPDTYLQTQEGQNLPIPHCYRGTDGWKIYKDLYEVAVRAVTTYNLDNGLDESKASYVLLVEKSTFGYSGWEYLIPDAEKIMLLGVCTDICVISNGMLLKAAFPEVPIFVVRNACAGTSEEAHENTLKVMESCQFKIVDEVFEEEGT